MWRGERSSWRCTNNSGCRGITSVHRGITKVHKGITKVHSGAARRRRRRIINTIHAAFIKGLGDITPSQDHTPSLACKIIVETTGSSTEVSIRGQEPPQCGSHGVAQTLMTVGVTWPRNAKREAGSSVLGMASMSCCTVTRYSVSPFRRSSK